MFDIITIGSATVDVFVTTKASSREILRHAHHHDVCLHLGAKVLIDDLVFDTGGGGTNAAVSFSRLGFRTGWLGVVGSDPNARTVLDAVKKDKVAFLGAHKPGRTGYSVILVGLEHDRTILTFKGVNDQLLPRDVPKLHAKWLYCSSMLGKSWNTFLGIVKQARKHGTKIAFNPSLYLASRGLAELMPVLRGLDVLVFNKEEAQALLGTTEKSIAEMLCDLALYVKIPVITDGHRGAYATDGKKVYMIMPRTIRVVETTGAGDAFASGFVAGQMMKKDIPTSLRLGQIQAESTLRAVGAKNDLATRKEAFAQLRRPHAVKVSELP